MSAKRNLKAIFIGVVASAALLLTACGAKLDDDSVREFIDRIDVAGEAQNSAAMNELLAPEFKATFELPEGRVSLTRDEMLTETAKPAPAEENRTSRLTISTVTIDPAANRATVVAAHDSEFTMQGHRMQVTDENTYVVELRDGKLLLVSLKARMKTMSMDGTKIH